MELWIRSQDKTKLVCVNSIRIEDTIDTNNNEFFILGSGYDLGIYSKKRALEVLNEIQQLIQPTYITTGYDYKCEDNPFDKLSFNLKMIPTKTEVKELSTYVYEMPKE